MGMVTVRVVPRAGRSNVVPDGAGGAEIRVRAAPEGGHATEEARRALARALDVAPSRIVLRIGARSRTKVFQVHGLTDPEIGDRLGRL